MSLREEFIQLAMQPGVNRRELCRRFGISPKTGYKWLARYTQEGAGGLHDRSRRPRHHPARTLAKVEQRVIALRQESRNSWGGRKLARLLAEHITRDLFAKRLGWREFEFVLVNDDFERAVTELLAIIHERGTRLKGDRREVRALAAELLA